MSSSASGPPRLVVWSRVGCLLCEEFIADLAALGGAVTFEVRDVDADVLARNRFSARVPVLTADGHEVCDVHLDVRRVRALFAG